VDRAKQGAAAGRSVEDVAGAYSVPARYGEFRAAPPTVTTIMQLVYDGR